MSIKSRSMSKIQKLSAEMKEKKAFWMMDNSVGITFTKNISPY